MTKETNTLNQSITRTYDALGRNTSVTDRAGNTSYFAYDNLGRLLKQEAPFEKIGNTVHMAARKYDYDQTGNITREQAQTNLPGTSATWSKTEYAYNSRNYLTAANSFDGPSIAQ